MPPRSTPESASAEPAPRWQRREPALSRSDGCNLLQALGLLLGTVGAGTGFPWNDQGTLPGDVAFNFALMHDADTRVMVGPVAASQEHWPPAVPRRNVGHLSQVVAAVAPAVGTSPSSLPSFGDRYKVERELGRGGMATVYLCLDTKIERRVAVKLLHPDLAAAVRSVEPGAAAATARTGVRTRTSASAGSARSRPG